MGKKYTTGDLGERVELRHEPVPGYRKALAVVVAIAALYLAVILVW